jgi:hypothetical protein
MNQPIFIIGFRRSGTSLLRVILNSHEEIAIGPEIKYLHEIIKEYPASTEDFIAVAEREIKDFEFTKEEAAECFNESKNWKEVLVNWCEKYRKKHNKNIWGDKTPQSFKYLKALKTAFPDAVYIHIVRHPLDVMGSLLKRNTYRRFRSIIGWYVANVRANNLKDKNYLFVKYEDFTQRPQIYIDQIMGKTGLTDTGILSTYYLKKHGRIAEGDIWNKPMTDASKTQKRQLLSKGDQLLIRVICAPLLKKYDY